MKHENIDDRARVWTVTMGTDRSLRAELEERVLMTIDPMAHALVVGVASDTDETD